MKFRPKQANGDVNVPKTHPLVEMAWLAGGLALIIASIYLFLTFLTGWIVAVLPVEAEVWIGKKILQNDPGMPCEPLQKRLNDLVDYLPQDSPLRKYQFSVRVVDSNLVNAVALPGGTIVVFSKLLKEINSENELSMILAHELGHYAHRDHLKRLGKGLIFGAASWFIFRDSSQPLLMPFVVVMDARYSQAQEEKADLWGLELLNKRYGHVGGAVDFFQRLLEKKDVGKLTHFLASHPHPKKRIEKLVSTARNKGYPIGKTEPIGEDIKEFLEKCCSKPLPKSED